MPRTLKVYGWSGRRRHEVITSVVHNQTREVMAAYSAAEVRRATGMTRGDWEHSGCETGNTTEIALAMAEPGAIFWQPLNARVRELWFRDDGTPADIPVS
jgi:hypothetical protein